MSDPEIRELEREVKLDPSQRWKLDRARARQGKRVALWRPMTDLEVVAIEVFCCAKLPGGTSPKRIRWSLAEQLDERRITDPQAAALWGLVWTYRRATLDGYARLKKFGYPRPDAVAMTRILRLSGLRALALGNTTRKNFVKTCGELSEEGNHAS